MQSAGCRVQRICSFIALLYTLHSTLCTGAEVFPMPVIAITGGIGSGKSSVRKMFEEFGAYGIDADELARKVVEPGTEGAGKLLEVFGPDFFDDEGNLDRRQMARKVFGDPGARRTIESLLHPLIRSAEKDLLEEFTQRTPDAVVVVEIPLLAEGGRSKEYDGVILVTAPEDVRVSRLVEAGKYDYDEAAARMTSQVDDGEREKFADWTVDNGGDREETKKQVKKIYQALVSSR